MSIFLSTEGPLEYSKETRVTQSLSCIRFLLPDRLSHRNPEYLRSEKEIPWSFSSKIVEVRKDETPFRVFLFDESLKCPSTGGLLLPSYHCKNLQW